MPQEKSADLTIGQYSHALNSVTGGKNVKRAAKGGADTVKTSGAWGFYDIPVPVEADADGNLPEGAIEMTDSRGNTLHYVTHRFEVSVTRADYTERKNKAADKAA